MNNADSLISAVNWNDLAWLKKQIESGLSPNEVNNFNETALMHASAKGFLEIVKYLIELNANLNLQSTEGLTALMLAADNGKTEAVKLLLAAGAKTELISLGLRTAYDYARLKAFTDIENILKPKSKIVKFEKITSGKKLSKKEKQKLNQELIRATWDKNLEKIQFLLANGADANEKSDNTFPIIIATIVGDENIIKQYIAQQVDLNVEDVPGITSLVKACGACQVDIARLLIENGAEVNDSVFMSANIHKHHGILKLLEKARFRTGTPNVKKLPKNQAEFLLACAKGNIDKVKELIKKIDIEKPDNDGGTALYWVSRKGHFEIAGLLIENNANVNFQSPNKWTPLMEASIADNIKIVELLIENKADPNLLTVENAGALHMACTQGNTEIVKLLLEAGADKNIKVTGGYFSGKTPLLLAEEQNFAEIINLLK